MLGHHGLAREFGVGANQAQLRLGAGGAHGLCQRVLEMCQRTKWALRQGALGNPGGVFIHAVEQLQCVGRTGGVELFERQGHVVCIKKVSC
ncbi:hypothetical protein D3C71_1832970 [compost metagenome]